MGAVYLADDNRLEGRQCAGVASCLGISESAVRQRLVRARLMLHSSPE